MLQSAVIVVLISVLCPSDSSLNDNQIIPAAIQTRHSVDIRSVPNSFQKSMPSEVIEVNGNQMSFVFILKSMSTPINVVHQHNSAKVPPVQHSNSVDEPHVLTHTINKPIIQEIREVISPYRHVIQEIRPVSEEIKTVVTKNGFPNQETTQPKYQTFFRRKPMTETTKVMDSTALQNMIDYSLYSGTSEYDMKYVSPNNQKLEHLMNKNNYFVYQMLKLYKDR